MAERYMKVSDLINELGKHSDIYETIDNTPEADVEEVKHGEWIKHSPDVAVMRAFHKLGIGKGMSENSIFWTCSCCDSWGTPSQKRCSECGAKMDGGIVK